MDNLMYHVTPHVEGVEVRYGELPPNLQRLVDLFRTRRAREFSEEETQEFLGLLEPYIVAQEECYDRLVDSRQELIRAFRKLKPAKAKTNIPVFVERRKETRIKKTKPSVLIEKSPVPVTSDTSKTIDFKSLEQQAEALLDEMEATV